MQFLKKHYEKIVLCLALLGLAAAVVWMGTAVGRVQEEVGNVVDAPQHGKPLAHIDLAQDWQALAQVTNPPPVVLAGDHNLFNPVTWRRKSNGEIIKILRTGPDALTITGMTPLYTIINYDHSSSGGVYVLNLQQHSGKKTVEYVKKDEKPRSGVYIVRGIKGATDDPTEIQIEIAATHELTWIKKGSPYQAIDGYTVDIKYDPESRAFPKLKVNDQIMLDSERYKMFEITNDLIRVQNIRNGKITQVKWTGHPL